MCEPDQACGTGQTAPFAGMLQLHDVVVLGAGQQDGQYFRSVLQALGFPLHDLDGDGKAVLMVMVMKTPTEVHRVCWVQHR